MVKKLLGWKIIDVNPKNSHGQTRIHFAIRGHNRSAIQLKILHELLSNLRMDITVRDKRGRSVLSYATEAGAMKAIKRLLNCQERQNNVVRLLNDSGDAKRILASQLCCLGGTLRCRRPPMQTKKIDSQVRSVDNMAGGNVFGIAAKRQHAKVIKELGKYYRDGVNSRDRDGRRPLCESVWGPNTDVLRELLDLGADINLPDFNRKPPVAYGIEKLDLVRFLIERGADINLPDNDGHTPLW